MGTYIHWFYKKCPHKSQIVEFLWGFLLIFTGVLLFAGIVHLISKISVSFSLLITLLSIPLLKVSFSIRSLLKSGKIIKEELEKGNLVEARKQTSFHLVSRNTDELSEEEICSCVIESLSENITDSFSSPVFYYLIFGLSGSWAYRFINTSDSMIAYRNAEFEWIGKFTAWCDSFLNYLPARISALMILLAAFLHPQASLKSGFHCLLKDRKKTASPNAGWTMSAMAGALDVTLMKKGEYRLHGGNSLLNSTKIDICLKITLLSLIITMIALVALIRGGVWALNMVV
jgi:adenosylcobinamide-phosphate synthase